MVKLFQRVREKIKERERDQRRKEKELLMIPKLDEATRIVTSLNNAIEDLWISFLTPPQGHLRSLIAVFMNGDSRFPNEFLSDFLDIFNHLCGFNTTGKEEYVKIFEEVVWNSHDDPDYETPKRLMEDLFDDLVENLWADLEVEEIVGAEQIEENKRIKRKLMEEFAKNSAAVNKKKAKAHRDGRRLARDLGKKQTQLKIAQNRFKNTVKK